MLILYTVLALVGVGAVIFIAKKGYKPFNWTIAAGSIILSLLAPWGVYSITAVIAKNSEQTYYEFWNGSETAVSVNTIACVRDGSCHNTYDCDPYTVMVAQQVSDGRGGTTTVYVAETHYHSCPYSTEETDYIISTTLGDFYAATSWMTGPEYRAGSGIPGGMKTAPPQAWTDAQARLAAGNPLGVTQVNSYKNFILAADTTLFENYSDRVDALLAESLIPTPASSAHSLYVAEKAYSAGTTGVDMPSMNRQLTQLNAYMGGELRGDLHVLFVDSDKAGNPTDYTNAVKAHWTSEAVGKHAIAKNTVTLVVGVVKEDGKPVVDWAKGFTGMPVGNEALIQQFSNLTGLPIDDNFIGSPVYSPQSGTYSMSGGAVEEIISGENKFNRVSMSALDEGDNGSGFAYLSDSWEMKPETKAIAISVSGVLSGIILIIGFVLALHRSDTYYYRELSPFPDPLGNFINKTTH